jgi:hypothetical protein
MTAAQWIGGLLVFAGIPFFLLGTLGLLRFPDVEHRLDTHPKLAHKSQACQPEGPFDIKDRYHAQAKESFRLARCHSLLPLRIALRAPRLSLR